MKDIRSIGHEFADICVSVIQTALRHIRNKPTFQEAPNVACSVLMGRTSNDLNDYFRDHYRHNFDPPKDMDDATELTGKIAIHTTNVVRKHTKLVLQDMYDEGINDNEFEELLFADIRSTVLELVADEYTVEEQLENVKF